MHSRLLRHRRRDRSEPTTGAAAPAGGRSLVGVLAAVSMTIFIIDLDFFALNLALPAMARELDAATTDVQWAISGFMLALAAFLVPGGRLGDILGRRRMLLIGLAIFGGASLAAGLAPNAAVLIAFRIVQGIGAAILFPLAIAVISNAFPRERQARAIGNAYGLGAIATASGPFAGGALTELIDWRAVLLINVPITLIAGLLVVRYVVESRDESVPRSIDLPGLAAVATGIAAITFAVDHTEDWGLGSPATLASLAIGATLLVLFVVRERRARWPLVDLELFRNRPYVLVTALGAVANIAFVTTTFTVAIYLQQVEGYSPLGAGVTFLAASIPTGLAGPLSGRLGERYDVATTMAVSSMLGAIGLLAVSFGTGLALYLPALALFGVGYGLGWSLVSIGTQAVVPPARAGQASGVTLAIVIGLAGLAVAIAATVIESGSGLGPAIEELLRWVAIGSALLVAALGALARRATRQAATVPR